LDKYRNALTVWYKHNKRELPWRECRDPYNIWVSEIILQQTRVQQGMSYYFSFLKMFPDIKSLAEAHEEDVLKVWQGLGYYSRASNMHHAAKTIMTEHQGRFPEDYHSIRQLKGIGDYTAAAISSIAFNLPYAVVDGNVFRVLSRLFGVSTPIDTTKGKIEFHKLAFAMLDKEQPGESNQTVMEFGALQCVPGQPNCIECPLLINCQAHACQTVTSLPVKSKQIAQKERFLNYIFLQNGENIFLEKRGESDIWRNMYQFPLIETQYHSSVEEVIGSPEWKEIFSHHTLVIESVFPEKIHLLTHQRLCIRFISVSLEGQFQHERLLRVDRSNVSRYPVPKPLETFLNESKL
jgi:A/G-specific adenine glycosylase